MVQKMNPRGVIWVPKYSAQEWSLVRKNDVLAVQYEDVHVLSYACTPVLQNEFRWSQL